MHQEINHALEAIKEEVIATRRDIHMHPELRFDVHRTAALAAQKLEALGLRVQRGIGRTGVVADLEVEGASRRIALRADMDALPMQELGEKPYKSTIDGAAHMCGHDAHTAMLLGAASLLVQFKKQLKVNVRFIFQPSEENFPGGAPLMIADGALDGVDKIYGLHVWPTLDTGRLGICDGPAMGQPDEFKITIHGKGGHAAFPHTSIDPIVLAAQYISNAQSIVARGLSPLDAGVISFTIFNAGTAHNIIPSKVNLTGTVRSLRAAVKKNMKDRLRTLLKSLCESSGAHFDFHYEDGYPVTLNHKEAVEDVHKAALRFLPSNQVICPHPPTLAGEDFGYYSQKIPACFSFLGCRNEAKGIVHTLHSPYFDIDEACLTYGVRLHTEIALSQK